jgi:hypothetical protein
MGRVSGRRNRVAASWWENLLLCCHRCARMRSVSGIWPQSATLVQEVPVVGAISIKIPLSIDRGTATCSCFIYPHDQCALGGGRFGSDSLMAIRQRSMLATTADAS